MQRRGQDVFHWTLGLCYWLSLLRRWCGPAYSSTYRGDATSRNNLTGKRREMASSVAVPQVRSVNPALQFLKLVPGVLLLAGVGYAGKLLEANVGKHAKAQHWTFPNIEYVLWAILIGLVISNTVGVPEIFRAGVATYEFWLKTGIVLLGTRFVIGDVLKLGGTSLALVAIGIVGAIAFMTFLGRVFKLKPKLTSLLAVGSAVCGVSAIIATQGAITPTNKIPCLLSPQ